MTVYCIPTFSDCAVVTVIVDTVVMLLLVVMVRVCLFVGLAH